MVERRCRFGFAPEALQRLPVVRHLVRQEFEGHETVQASVLSLVHYTHSAAAEFLQDAVVRDRLADKRIELRHSGAILGCRLRQVNECTNARSF